MGSIMLSNFAVLSLLIAFAFAASAADIFTIRVVDEATGRGVPLVELKTVNDISFWTDSAGVVAFNEPGMVGREVFFYVSSPGYEYPKDGFGMRGVRLKTSASGSAEVKIKRVQIAERMYRVTGAGIYRDSVLAGPKPPLREPLLNGLVLGQDTVSATPYRGKLYWFYGDTNRLSYPLGNFGGTGAVSELPGKGGLDPSVGVDLTYFTGADGFARPMFPKEEFGEGLQWIEGEFTLTIEGKERMLARVASGTGMEKTREWHLAMWDDDKEHFVKVARWDSIGFHDSSHAFKAMVNGATYIYLFPDVRVPARLEALKELKNYEAFTCMTGDKVDRDAAGRAQYSWKAGAPRQDTSRLVKRGTLKAEESWLRLLDIDTGKPLPGGRGSVYWNDYRRRWVMIWSGAPGEIWFSEADTPTGPWCYARRVLDHGNYNFYNPTQHPFFDQDGGRLIYFEGTYTDSFSGAKSRTPRYDYNQMMYRLALDDPRLALPVPVYRTAGGLVLSEDMKDWKDIRDVVFCAVPPDRKHSGLIPVWRDGDHFTATAPAPDYPPQFLALPDRDAPSTEPLKDAAGKVIAHVWKYPLSVLPLDPGVVPVSP